MITVENAKANLGTIRKGTTTHVFWNFEGNPEEIVYIQPGCGCTADCKVVGNQIVATYTENEKYTLKEFPSGEYPITKTITLFLKDEHDLKIESPQGHIFNPEKKKTTLSFSAKVAIPR